MRKTLVAILFSLLITPLYAQQAVSAREAIQQWDTEHLLDSLDQEKLPRVVSGGVILSANMSNFLTTHNDGTISSYMKIGGETGGFLDFRVTKHFAIQGRVVFTAEQNQFAVDETMRQLWSFGVDLPVYFLGRFGNMEKGYLQFGAGPFTHFTFASNIGGQYSNNLATLSLDPDDPYAKVYVLHDNHSGLSATVGYEFPIGIQINANYMLSLSDIFNYHKQEGIDTSASIYPQRISLGVGYRWK